MVNSDDEPDKKIIENVSMNDDGTLTISFASMMKGVSPGMKVWHAEPGSSDFIEFQNRHGVTKPGQESTITKELRAGKWAEHQVKEGTDWS